MAVYKHGVYVTEQPTGVVAPVQSTAGLQVVIGTAPINRASDPYHCTNVPILATSLKPDSTVENLSSVAPDTYGNLSYLSIADWMPANLIH